MTPLAVRFSSGSTLFAPDTKFQTVWTSRIQTGAPATDQSQVVAWDRPTTVHETGSPSATSAIRAEHATRGQSNLGRAAARGASWA
jgi:hypothetical protein